jgi:hypothetical protein
MSRVLAALIAMAPFAAAAEPIEDLLKAGYEVQRVKEMGIVYDMYVLKNPEHDYKICLMFASPERDEFQPTSQCVDLEEYNPEGDN